MAVPPLLAAAPLPWEDPIRSRSGAFLETLRLIALEPTEAFRRMPRDGGFGRPLLWLIVTGWIGVAVSQVWSLLLTGVTVPFMEKVEGLTNLGINVGVSVALMVFAPVILVIGVFVQSALLHLMLLLVGGARHGFEATMRVCCYAGTAQLAGIVPWCGGLVSVVWTAALLIIGFAAAHETDHGRASVAVFLPLVLCCVLGVLAAVSLGGLAAFLASQ